MTEATVTTETAETTVDLAPAETAPAETTDHKAEAEKWKALARQNETKAKANAAAAKRLAEVEQASKTELEKAVEKALEDGKVVGRKEAAQTVAAARLEAALTGLVPDPKSIVEDLNLAKFVTDDGEIDDDAIAALKEKYAAANTTATTAPGPRPDLTQGATQAVALNDDALLKTITDVLAR